MLYNILAAGIVIFLLGTFVYYNIILPAIEWWYVNDIYVYLALISLVLVLLYYRVKKDKIEEDAKKIEAKRFAEESKRLAEEAEERRSQEEKEKARKAAEAKRWAEMAAKAKADKEREAAKEAERQRARDEEIRRKAQEAADKGAEEDAAGWGDPEDGSEGDEQEPQDDPKREYQDISILDISLQDLIERINSAGRFSEVYDGLKESRDTALDKKKLSRRLIQKVHPDKNKGKGISEKVLTEATAKLNILSGNL